MQEGRFRAQEELLTSNELPIRSDAYFGHTKRVRSGPFQHQLTLRPCVGFLLMPRYWSFPHEELGSAACKGGRTRRPGASEYLRGLWKGNAAASAFANGRLGHCDAEDSMCARQQLSAQ